MRASGWVGRVAVALVVAVLVAGACSDDGGGDDDEAAPTSDGGAAAEGPNAPANDAPWPMHTVDSRYKGANALGTGDLDGDGLDDYVTNYEFDQRYVVTLHPPAGEDPSGPWETVTVWQPPVLADGYGVNPESAALGDLDGDGNLDVVGGQGYSDLAFWEGSEPGVRVVWGPPAERLAEPGAWVDGGRVPATVDAGHFHFVDTRDVDEDGRTDIVVGGRVHGGNGNRAGVRWIEAPDDPAARRDLSQWQVHVIDGEQYSAHGFVFADLDEDGDDDIVVANADFDTPAEDEAVLWYENPGPGTVEQTVPWRRHEIYRGDEFHTKPQVTVADLDDDGADDVIVQTPDDVYWFRRTSSDPVAFEHVVIPKAPEARWLSRPIRVVDVDGDGRLDLVGGLVHEDGTLPHDKASVFWMQYTGEEPGSDGWTTHVVKWGAGKTGGFPEFGEKWDQFELTDVDGDGDPDIVANNEEWWEDGGAGSRFYEPHLPAVHAVVWFENTVGEPADGCVEADGTCVVEAERASDAGDGSIVARSGSAAAPGSPGYEGAVGEEFVQHTAIVEPDPFPWSATEGLTYDLELEGGRYVVWLRARVPSAWGTQMGGPSSDSIWVSVDGAEPEQPIGDDEPVTDEWIWIRLDQPLELDAGTHELGLRGREGGFAVDRLVLTTDADLVPQGEGPPETVAG